MTMTHTDSLYRTAGRPNSARPSSHSKSTDSASKSTISTLREKPSSPASPNSSVMTNTSVTLQETGIAEAIDSGGPYESARNNMLALDYATQLRER